MVAGLTLVVVAARLCCYLSVVLLAASLCFRVLQRGPVLVAAAAWLGVAGTFACVLIHLLGLRRSRVLAPLVLAGWAVVVFVFACVLLAGCGCCWVWW